MLTAVLRLCGQLAGDPIGVLDQPKARVRSPISPPPARKASSQELMASISELRRYPEWRRCLRLLFAKQPQPAFDHCPTAVTAITQRSRCHEPRADGGPPGDLAQA